jgi:glutaredoxin
MKTELKWVYLFSLALFFTSMTETVFGVEPELNNQSCLTIEVFTWKGCPHCADAKIFLEKLKIEYPQFVVINRDIKSSTKNTQRFLELNDKFEIDKPGVPSFFICNQFLIGFGDEQTTGLIIKRILGLTDSSETGVAVNQIKTSLFGSVNVEKLGLPLFTTIIGLIDGFNPCAMWVLLLLLSILVNLKDRKRIIMIAGTFVFVSGAVYFVFMAAWLNLFLIIGFSRTLQIIVGIFALLMGAVHIKDYFAFKQGFSLSIPDSAKPTIYSRIRDVINAENMPAAFIAVITIAIMVNLVELLCTAGLPAIYTQILTSQQLNTAQYYAYLLLYNIAYVFDDALMVGIVVYTLSKRSLQEGQGRLLKLLSGSVIFILGVMLIFTPALLI